MEQKVNIQHTVTSHNPSGVLNVNMERNGSRGRGLNSATRDNNSHMQCLGDKQHVFVPKHTVKSFSKGLTF